MKTLVAVYETHKKALQAVDQLKNNGFDTEKVSILGKADLINNHVHIKTNDTAEAAEVSLGVIAGTTLGILTGIGVFTIPGLGFLYGAGALVGGIAGADLGAFGSSIIAILTFAGVEKHNAKKYEDHLNECKFLLFVRGDQSDIDTAEKILNTDKLHLELDSE
ncbi:hypothetical protein NHF50_14000 [Flavobacterium sp. NRK F10]|uniref:General stress protein 17M-like domain-containing protein n=1 Tax=Flavobacterium sediminis TaxID=2201181 RepID=A0A2U8QYB5_9FLAO|nr:MULTISPECIES: general stress protein [Flavobacterium]AWM14906.1 hypothetical protein DI487_14280 [Flavobacterium sediminis]MCO6176161.1 hypothetical protein [Flavobacterium sp. NRK F10]